MESIQVGLRLNLFNASQVPRVNVDTTLMEKNVRYPRMRGLLDSARRSS